MLIETELNWAYAVLGVSFLIESVVLGKAINTALEGAYTNKMTLRKKLDQELRLKDNNILLNRILGVVLLKFSLGVLRWILFTSMKYLFLLE